MSTASEFSIDPGELSATRERAAVRASSGEAADLARDFRAGIALDDESLAALLLAPAVDSEDLLASARARSAPVPRIETFSPLYISNECDAECLMCGMRRLNTEIRRDTADEATIDDQLDILHRRGLRGVALLTGEYRYGARRKEMHARTAKALRRSLACGFEHVLINIGSLEPHEYPGLLDGLPRQDDGRVAPHVTMCTFQESYDPHIYAKFMGTAIENPRSDYARRLSNFNRAADAGMRFANPGILVGLNRDLAYELLALLEHVHHLAAREMAVYISLPRLRKASGAAHSAGASDDDLIRLVALLSAGVPDAKLVISTREPPDIQRKLLPVIGVLTPGSPGVAPYTDAGARFEVEASQFEVLDHRPIEAILGEHLAAGATIDGYEPPVT